MQNLICKLRQTSVISKGKDTLWDFSFRVFHEIQFQGHFMKYEILSWNTFTLGSQLLLIDKKSVYREKMTSDSEDLITLILINNICYSKSKSKKKSKRPKGIWMKPWLKNRNDKSVCNNIFSELLLTDKEEFRRYLQMNTTSYEVK